MNIAKLVRSLGDKANLTKKDKQSDIIPLEKKANFTAKKIKLENNIPINRAERVRIDEFCDVINAVKAARPEYIKNNQLDPKIAMPNGLIWDGLDDTWGGSWGAFRNKSHLEINMFRIIGNVFSDRSTVVYQDDDVMPDPNEWDWRFLDIANATPKEWVAKIPPRFGEIGWDVDGYPVNWTTTTHQERLSLIYLSGIGDLLQSRLKSGRSVRCMEVGGGAGEMGYLLSAALPGITWYDCDLPESLIHSVVYLATLLPKKTHYIYTGRLKLPDGINKNLILTDPKQAAAVKDAVVSIPNFLIHDFEADLQLDFAFNTWSFSEMSHLQATDYGHFIKKVLRNHGVMLEQNIDLRFKPKANYCKEHFAKIFSHRYPVLQEEYPNILDKIKLYGGEVDIWANTDPRRLLKPFSNNINGNEILSSMWRRCGRPWAHFGAAYLEPLFDRLGIDARNLSGEQLLKD